MTKGVVICKSASPWIRERGVQFIHTRQRLSEKRGLQVDRPVTFPRSTAYRNIAWRGWGNQTLHLRTRWSIGGVSRTSTCRYVALMSKTFVYVINGINPYLEAELWRHLNRISILSVSPYPCKCIVSLMQLVCIMIMLIKISLYSLKAIMLR